MGSCWSDGSYGGRGGMAGVGGTTSSAGGGYSSPNDAVDHYLKSRGFNGLFSQIEVRSFDFSFDQDLKFYRFSLPCLLVGSYRFLLPVCETET